MLLVGKIIIWEIIIIEIFVIDGKGGFILVKVVDGSLLDFMISDFIDVNIGSFFEMLVMGFLLLFF